jgi:hypothetical protein
MNGCIGSMHARLSFRVNALVLFVCLVVDDLATRLAVQLQAGPRANPFKLTRLNFRRNDLN